MTTAIANTKTFEESMMERIRTSIGDLMPDEELKKILSRGIEDAFFKPRLKKSDDWGHKEYEVSLVEKITYDVLGVQMNKAVCGWMDTHSGEIKDVVDKVLREGIGKCLLFALDSHFSGALQNLANDLKGRGVIQ